MRDAAWVDGRTWSCVGPHAIGNAVHVGGGDVNAAAAQHCHVQGGSRQHGTLMVRADLRQVEGGRWQ